MHLTCRSLTKEKIDQTLEEVKFKTINQKLNFNLKFYNKNKVSLMLIFIKLKLINDEYEFI